MNKIILPFIVVCWIFGAALTFCLPAHASLSTSPHATLVSNQCINETTTNSNDQLSTVVNINNSFQTTTNSYTCIQPFNLENNINKTGGYDSHDHYSKHLVCDVVTTRNTQVTTSQYRKIK
uniref:Uncharacterized protein n=1 Tax=Pectobacterium carotovorum TaxID=554 RepID=A0A0K0MPJ8_PECCA|nr:hypothetical protein [Pectobacterium carotovorum]AKG47533.1 hypothetical protein pA_00093 [Pectobacterium carotovorum]